MKTNTTIRSPGALALGLFFGGVTARVVLDDVWHGAPFTVAHVNTVAALIGAIASGHMIWPSLKKAQIAAALGLALIFVGASGYIVISSGSRNAEAMQSKAVAIVKANEARAAQRAKIAEAEGDVDLAKAAHDKAKADAAKECSTGKKSKCDGRTETRDYAGRDLEKAESHAKLMRIDLAVLGADEVPNAGYKSTAKAFEALGFGKADDLEGRMILILPFISVLISELGTLTFIGMALGHSVPSAPSRHCSNDAPVAPGRSCTSSNQLSGQNAKRQPAVNVEASSVAAPMTAPRPPRPKRKRVRRDNAELIDFAAQFRARHGRSPNIPEMRDAFPKGATTSLWRAARRA